MPPVSMSPTPTPTCRSRVSAARTWWTAGTAKASLRTGDHRRRCAQPVLLLGPTPAGAQLGGVHDRIPNHYVVDAIKSATSWARRRWRRPRSAGSLQRRAAGQADGSVWNTVGGQLVFDDTARNCALGRLHLAYWMATRSSGPTSTSSSALVGRRGRHARGTATGSAAG